MVSSRPRPVDERNKRELRFRHLLIFPFFFLFSVRTTEFGHRVHPAPDREAGQKDRATARNPTHDDTGAVAMCRPCNLCAQLVRADLAGILHSENTTALTQGRILTKRRRFNTLTRLSLAPASGRTRCRERGSGRVGRRHPRDRASCSPMTLGARAVRLIHWTFSCNPRVSGSCAI